MDSVVAQLLARLSMYLTQELDFHVDSGRFADEAEYAAQVLDLVEEMHDDEFRDIARQIRKRQLDLFSLKNASAPREAAASSPSAGDEADPLRNGKRI